MSDENRPLDDANESAKDFAQEAKRTANEFADSAKETFQSSGDNKKILVGILAIIFGAYGGS